MAKVTGTFAATGVSKPLNGSKQGLTLVLADFGVGTIQLQVSWDGGATWEPWGSYTADTAAVVDSKTNNVSWRLECTAYTSGTLKYCLAN